MKPQSRFRLLALVPALLAAFAASAQTLKPGDPAPPIKVAAWTQGEPVEKFQPGQLYVVEFWATWCGPCKTSIPHLTKLSKEYEGKVKFVGVSVWENVDDQVSHVAKFVQEMGDQMTYTVAVDGDDKTMATTWMQAAAQNGIPSAFIVGKDGKVLWIGHPMSMDDPLKEVVAGTFDAGKFAAEFAEEQAKEAAAMAKRQRMNEARTLANSGKNAEALKILEELAKDDDPSIAQAAGMQRLGLQFDTDRKAFDKSLAQMAKDGQHDALAGFAAQTSRAAAAPNANDAAKGRMAAALAAADMALKAAKPSPILLYQVGLTYSNAGDKAKASKTLEAALKAFDGDPEYRDDEGWKGLRNAITQLIDKNK